jgi:hypothetical protein
MTFIFSIYRKFFIYDYEDYDDDNYDVHDSSNTERRCRMNSTSTWNEGRPGFKFLRGDYFPETGFSWFCFNPLRQSRPLHRLQFIIH